MPRDADLAEIEDVVSGIAEALSDPDDWGETTRQNAVLRDVDMRQFGMAVLMRDGRVIEAGSARTPFSIQSISKLFAVEIALEALGEDLWKRVGREPSGDPFNSIVDLERDRGVPRNPFINAGALVVIDALLDAAPDRDEPAAVVRFIDALLEGDGVAMNEEVARSGEEGADLNRSIAHMAKHFGNLENDVDEVISAYGRQCSIELSCVQLAQAGRFLMLDGPDEAARRTGRAARRASRIGALMMTCGQYDGSGDFAYRVGMPAKSGVGGGILAIAPRMASVAVWSPGLDANGNSLLGTAALEMLTDRVDWSVFGAVGTRG